MTLAAPGGDVDAHAGGCFDGVIIPPPLQNPCILKASVSVRNSAYCPHTPCSSVNAMIRKDLQLDGDKAFLARFVPLVKGEVY